MSMSRHPLGGNAVYHLKGGPMEPPWKMGMGMCICQASQLSFPFIANAQACTLEILAIGLACTCGSNLQVVHLDT